MRSITISQSKYFETRKTRELIYYSPHSHSTRFARATNIVDHSQPGIIIFHFDFVLVRRCALDSSYLICFFYFIWHFIAFHESVCVVSTAITTPFSIANKCKCFDDANSKHSIRMHFLIVSMTCATWDCEIDSIDTITFELLFLLWCRHRRCIGLMRAQLVARSYLGGFHRHHSVCPWLRLLQIIFIIWGESHYSLQPSAMSLMTTFSQFTVHQHGHSGESTTCLLFRQRNNTFLYAHDSCSFPNAAIEDKGEENHPHISQARCLQRNKREWSQLVFSLWPVILRLLVFPYAAHCVWRSLLVAIDAMSFWIFGPRCRFTWKEWKQRIDLKSNRWISLPFRDWCFGLHIFHRRPLRIELNS